MTKELEKAMLTPEEILAVPSGETVYNDDGSMDIRASRLNREIEIAKAQLAKAIPIIAEAERKKVAEEILNMVGCFFWIDDDSKTAGLLVTGTVVYSELKALKSKFPSG